MKDFLNEKLIPPIMQFTNTKAMLALKDGLLYSMPVMMIGAVFLLLGNFPLDAVTNVLDKAGLIPVLNQAANCTFSIISLIAAVGIAYTYVKNEGYNGLPAGVISLCTYLILQPSTVMSDGAEVGVILKTWTGGQGMIAALISGLVVGWVYSLFLNKNVTIKMPAGVPEGVAAAFTSLIPGLVLVTGTTIIYAVFKIGFGITPIEWIYEVFQLPLQGLTDSFGGVVAMGFLIPFFWFFGIHGSTLISDAIMGPLLLANSASNQAILDAGLELTIANGGHIVTRQFVDQFITVTGAGVTIGLVVYMAFFARSKQLREIGKLGLIPSFFNVNEPVLFGTPIVLNPMLLVPFIMMPILAGVIQYAAIYFGLCPLYGGVVIPWTTPPIISGFLIGGWKTALLQAVILVLTFFVYLPFIKAVDKKNAEQEKMAEAE